TPWPRCRSRGVPLLSTTRFALTIRIDDDPWFRSANRCPERSPQWCKVCFPRSREQRLAIRATQNMTPSGTTHYVYDRQGASAGRGFRHRQHRARIRLVRRPAARRRRGRRHRIAEALVRARRSSQSSDQDDRRNDQGRRVGCDLPAVRRDRVDHGIGIEQSALSWAILSYRIRASLQLVPALRSDHWAVSASWPAWIRRWPD